MARQTVILWVVVGCIVASIFFLEKQRPAVTSVQSTGVPLASNAERQTEIAAKSKQYQRAKELASPTGFVNADPFTLASLVGKKVILLDFWTYSCINCQRTLPYLTAWYDKYHDQGLEIIGVHTPEFDFEKNIDNVRQAVQKFGIKYPVVLDSNYGTWQAYRNNYWPHEYLIDIDGFIVEDHIGEGDYDKTEAAIQQLLKERADVLQQPQAVAAGTVAPANAIAFDQGQVGSPETYFGAARNEYLANGTVGQTGVQQFTAPKTADLNGLYLDGSWDISSQYAQSQGVARIIYHYRAKNVYFVASALQPMSVAVLQDGRPVAHGGADAASGTAAIHDERLYHLVANPDYEEHTLEIDIPAAGLRAFTFTFG
jgi:thiol-disulfide isomerase/thioredoxin